MRPPLVALHGFGDAGECWLPFLRRAGLDDAAHTPHLLAHGGRTMPADLPFSHEALVADVLPQVAAAARAGASPVVLLGHSLGASTAAGVAAAAPDLVAALVLEDPPWSPPRTPAQDAAAERHNDFLDWLVGLQGSDDAGRQGWVRHRHPDWPDDEVQAWAQAKARVDLALFGADQRWLRRGWGQVAVQVRCPVLLLRGHEGRGAACHRQVAEALAALPRWQVLTLPTAGHDVRRDAPQQAARAVHALLAELAGG
jgi:pimeloyl-ACP methyl ester carboxylesterase